LMYYIQPYVVRILKKIWKIKNKLVYLYYEKL
jgi:hypothetical protein